MMAEPTFGFPHFLILFGGLQSLVVVAYQLGFSSKKTASGFYFALLLLGLALTLTGFVFREIFSPLQVPLVFFGPLFAPAFYGYVKSFTGVGQRLSWAHFVLFWLLATYTLYNFVIHYNTPAYYDWLITTVPVLEVIAMLHFTVYFFLGARLALSVWKELRPKKLGWMRIWLGFLTITLSLIMLSMNVQLAREWLNVGTDYLYLSYLVLLISTSLIIYAMAFWRLFVPEIVQVPSRRARARFRKISSSEPHPEMQQLVELMEKEKPYTRPDLTLEVLADMIHINPKRLSAVLNEGGQTSFNEFVNRYRVEEVKIKLSNPEFDHLNIIALGLDSGFNSKSTFNSAFKRHTGKTPVQFRKEFQAD